jgi:hypothetical protein
LNIYKVKKSEVCIWEEHMAKNLLRQ